MKEQNFKTYYQRVQEYNTAIQIEKTVRKKTCQSGIGTERIKQMEVSKAMMEREKQKMDKKNGNRGGGSLLSLHDPMFI